MENAEAKHDSRYQHRFSEGVDHAAYENLIEDIRAFPFWFAFVNPFTRLVSEILMKQMPMLADNKRGLEAPRSVESFDKMREVARAVSRPDRTLERIPACLQTRGSEPAS